MTDKITPGSSSHPESITLAIKEHPFLSGIGLNITGVNGIVLFTHPKMGEKVRDMLSVAGVSTFSAGGMGNDPYMLAVTRDNWRRAMQVLGISGQTLSILEKAAGKTLQQTPQTSGHSGRII